MLAVNAAGPGPVATASTTTSPMVASAPGAPRAVAARFDAVLDRLFLTYTAPADDGGSALTGYQVYLDGSLAGVVPPSSTSVFAAGPFSIGSHSIGVRAVNDQGPGPLVTDSAVAAYAPEAPTRVVAKPGGRSARVTWTPGSANGASITGYTITASPGGASSTVGASATSGTVAGLTRGRSYTFRVTATSSVGSTASAPSGAVVPAGRPGRPGRPRVSATGRTVVVAWAAASAQGSRITSYRITVSGARNVTTSGPRRVVLRHVRPGRHTVRITAVNSIGRSVASRPAVAVVRR